MAYRYEFTAAAARDLFKLTRHNHPLLVEIVAEHIPKLLQDPLAFGEPKRGDLAGVRAYNLIFRGVAYRMVYSVSAEVVLFIAIGPHDDAHNHAARRRKLSGGVG